MADKFSIFPYSIGKLQAIFVEKTKASWQVVSSKLHCFYFENYFDAVEAKTILIECDYVDRDFLEDFSGYYVRCFSEYPRQCTRLHFFNISFSKSEFESLLLGDKDSDCLEKLQTGYLGFIVLKPLPETIIGRTCLKVYPTAEEQPGVSQRYFPTVRLYEANLFGIPLKVKTLAFQEQDRVAAACATSALWSTFQATGILFQHLIPSPVEITKSATINSQLLARSLPSQGLTAHQIAQAILSVGLEPLLVQTSEKHLLKNTLYAYLRSQIPVVMIVDLFDMKSSFPSHLGRHAVVVSGYCLGQQQIQGYGQSGFLLRLSQIDKIYAHDDQVGPFARMIFDNVSVPIMTSVGQKDLFSISTSWKSPSSGQIGDVRAVPEIVLVPLYHKIRIPFEAIQALMLSFDAFIETLRTQASLPLLQRLEWDIYLTSISEFKEEFFKLEINNGSLKKEVLTEPMPRFLWRASAFCDDDIALDLLFDATDIEQGQLFIRAIEYKSDLSIFLRTIAKEPSLEKTFQGKLEWKILEWFKTQPVS